MYKLTNQRPWSKPIAHCRLIWFGHLARLPDNTPAKRALIHALKPVKLPSGRPRDAWINLIKKQMKSELEIPSIITAMKKAQSHEMRRNFVNQKCTMQNYGHCL